MPDESERGDGSWPPGAWLLRMRVEVPCALDPPVVQYAVFSEDPAHQFAAGLKRLQGVYQRNWKRSMTRNDDKSRKRCSFVRFGTSSSGPSLETVLAF